MNAETIRQRILDPCREASRIPVRVDEWDCTIWVRPITGADRDEIEQGQEEDRKAGRQVLFRARLVACMAHDQAGRRIFSRDDAIRLGNLSGMALDQIIAAAAKAGACGTATIEEASGN